MLDAEVLLNHVDWAARVRALMKSTDPSALCRRAEFVKFRDFKLLEQKMPLDSLKRKLYDAGRRMATAYAPE